MDVKNNVERIDTNVIVRLITQDDPKMVRKAKGLIRRKNKTYVFEDAAMMEVVFVLSGICYRYNREEVSRGIKAVMGIENICFNKGLIEEALDLYVAHSNLSFVDCYLTAASVISGETPLWTFDRKLAAQCPVAKAL